MGVVVSGYVGMSYTDDMNEGREEVLRRMVATPMKKSDFLIALL